jgi:hypothetical protein
LLYVFVVLFAVILFVCLGRRVVTTAVSWMMAGNACWIFCLCLEMVIGHGKRSFTQRVLRFSFFLSRFQVTFVG